MFDAFQSLDRQIADNSTSRITGLPRDLPRDPSDNMLDDQFTTMCRSVLAVGTVFGISSGALYLIERLRHRTSRLWNGIQQLSIYSCKELDTETPKVIVADPLSETVNTLSGLVENLSPMEGILIIDRNGVIDCDSLRLRL